MGIVPTMISVIKKNHHPPFQLELLIFCFCLTKMFLFPLLAQALEKRCSVKTLYNVCSLYLYCIPVMRPDIATENKDVPN